MKRTKQPRKVKWEVDVCVAHYGVGQNNYMVSHTVVLATDRDEAYLKGEKIGQAMVKRRRGDWHYTVTVFGRYRASKHLKGRTKRDTRLLEALL